MKRASGYGLPNLGSCPSEHIKQHVSERSRSKGIVSWKFDLEIYYVIGAGQNIAPFNLLDQFGHRDMSWC